METVFTIGNGAMCSRGVFEEGYPGAMPACFVHRVWDDMPVNYTELANIPAWWGVCLLYTSPSPRDRTSSRMPTSA